MTIINLFREVSTTFPPINDATINNGKSIIERIDYYNRRFMTMINSIPEHDWFQTFHVSKLHITSRLEAIFKDIKTIIERNLATIDAKSTSITNTRLEDKEIINNYFFNRDSPSFLESKYTLYPSNMFYKIRKDNNEWEKYTQTSLFHISKNKHFNQNYRYGNNNLEYPILYLASSPYLALIECQLNKLETNFCIAGYRFSDSVKVLNFSYTNTDTPSLSQLYKIPFIYSSSFVVIDKRNKYEYILPQLIMEAFIDNNCELMISGNYEKFDGICYQSAHSTNNSMYNIAFPAIECDSTDGYCNRLARLFKMTAPLHIDTKTLKTNDIDRFLKEQLLYMPKDYIRKDLKEKTPQSPINLKEKEIMYFCESSKYFSPYFDIEKWCIQYTGEKKDKNIGYRYTRFAIETIRVRLMNLRKELEPIHSIQEFKVFESKYPNVFFVKSTEEIRLLKHKIDNSIIK
ncbi:MAG: RES domain-containing protein [Bacteroidaceae bacterium]|nr:RES domain-containing protein [Bacteroidaceae bacterium]